MKQMMWKLNHKTGEMVRAEVVAVSGSYVHVLRHGLKVRESRDSTWHSWHHDWNEAHARLIDEMKHVVRISKLRLSTAERRLREAEMMKPPRSVSATKAGVAK